MACKIGARYMLNNCPDTGFLQFQEKERPDSVGALSGPGSAPQAEGHDVMYIGTKVTVTPPEIMLLRGVELREIYQVAAESYIPANLDEVETARAAVLSTVPAAPAAR